MQTKYLPDFKRVEARDWCHVCGHRVANCVRIRYAKNAEHSLTGMMPVEHSCSIRMCAACCVSAHSKILYPEAKTQ